MSDTTKPPHEKVRRKLTKAGGDLKHKIGRQQRKISRDLKLEADEVSHRIDRTMRRVEREMKRTTHRVQQKADDLAFEFSDQRDRAKEQVEDLAWQAGRWVRANPTRALLSAFAVGLVFGLSVGACCGGRSADDDLDD